MLRYHVTCGLEKKIANVDDAENLMDAILALFSVSSGVAYILQVWEPDFDDFIDVENIRTIPDKSKLQLIIKGNLDQL
jgi:hypothetical protein